MRQIIMLLCCLPLATAAQNFHFSARLGIANYQGDLQAKRVTFKQAKFLGSLGAQYDLSEHFTARTYFTLSSLQADDKKGTSAMKMRNLNFATKLFEWELGAQYNILSLRSEERRVGKECRSRWGEKQVKTVEKVVEIGEDG